MSLAALLVAVIAAQLAEAPQRGPAPDAVASVRIPDSALDLELAYRQFAEDELGPFVEPFDVDAVALRELRVQAVLSQRATLSSDVQVKIGEHELAPGRYPLAFTVDQGEAMRFFLVVGRDVLPLASTPVEVERRSPRLVMTLLYLDRTAAQVHWHIGDHAGVIELRLGPAR